MRRAKRRLKHAPERLPEGAANKLGHFAWNHVGRIPRKGGEPAYSNPEFEVFCARHGDVLQALADDDDDLGP